MTHVPSSDGSLGRCGHVGVAGQHYFHLSHRTPYFSSLFLNFKQVGSRLGP